MSQIVIFASGSGTNAEAIIRYFSTKSVRVGAVFCNNPQAGVVDKAKSLGVQLELFDKTQLVEGDVLSRLQVYRPDLIVLAGFIWRFPKSILEVFPKVVNIHPALLPKYGGKGMYGTYVHQAVLEIRYIMSTSIMMMGQLSHNLKPRLKHVPRQHALQLKFMNWNNSISQKL